MPRPKHPAGPPMTLGDMRMAHDEHVALLSRAWPRGTHGAKRTLSSVRTSWGRTSAGRTSAWRTSAPRILPKPEPGDTFEDRARKHASKFIGRGEPGASEIMANLFDPNYLQQNELVFIGSPETVAQKIQSAAKAGVFNVFMGKFKFFRFATERFDALDPAVRREGDSGAPRV
jgi:alkanesulfonate monooxygenase SsuD/methylene tetrahydromethanopterin reductase-like flavin-dependent oxidoreductase (luciferase family)